MAEIDTQPPPWLQRNWSPRETYDPTPWLQHQYSLNMERQLMPLKVQQLSLANQSEQLSVAHQAMVNEQAGMEMEQFRNDMPIIDSWWKETGGDPTKILSMPSPMVKSVKAQQQVLNARKMAADTTLGMAYMAEQTALTQSTAELIHDGYDIDEARNENGTLDPRKIRLMADARRKNIEQRELNAIRARQEHYYDPFTGELIGGYGRGGKSGSALSINMELLDTHEKLYQDAVDSGDFDTAEKEQEKIDMIRKDITRSHHDVQLESEIRLNERLITSLTTKIASEIIPAKKAEMQTRLDAAQKRYRELISGRPVPTRTTLPSTTVPTPGVTNYIWTISGTKEVK